MCRCKVPPLLNAFFLNKCRRHPLNSRPPHALDAGQKAKAASPSSFLPLDLEPKTVWGAFLGCPDSIVPHFNTTYNLRI